MDGLASRPKGPPLSTLQALFDPSPEWPARGRLLWYGAGDAAELEAAAARLGLPAGEAVKVRVAVPAGAQLEARQAEALAVPVGDALPALLRLPRDSGPLHRPVCDSLRAWSAAARLALAAVAAQRAVPALRVAAQAGGPDDAVHGVWRVEPGEHGGRESLVRLAAALPRAAHALVRDDGALWDPLALLEAFEEAVADHAVRAGGEPPAPGRPRARLLPWTARWAAALADPADPVVPLRDDAAELVAAVAAWGRPEDSAGVLHLRLEAPDAEDGPWLVHLALLGSDGLLRPAARVWEPAEDDPLPAPALHEALLRGVALAARLSPPFEDALRAAAPEAVELGLADAWEFLVEAQPALRDAGAVVEVPLGLAEQAVRLRFVVGDDDGAVTDAGTGAEADDFPVDFTDSQEEFVARWEVDLGGEVLGEEELAALAEHEVPLVRWRDQWVLVDPERLAALRRLRGPARLGLGEALALALSGGHAAELDLDGVTRQEDTEVVARGRVAHLAERIRDAGEPQALEGEPPGFEGELRPYQRRGVAWLGGMAALGLGGILADDMGLGKTVQLIAHLLQADVRAGRLGRHLIVCPTSVLGNWERELHRFAPALPVARFHGQERPDDLGAFQGVVLTSYGMLRREPDPFAAVPWDIVTVDEAQHVKNPATAGARAVRRLRAAQRVAMTGTPLENRLADLWALMDLVNPGLLGARSVFDRRYATPIERRADQGAARRLRRLVGPFVLRREKRDPAVIADLPDKIEREVVCGLTTEQAALYEETVTEAFRGGLGDGIARRGRVLALLTALKQICNHPAQYRKREDEDLHGRSGKLATAREIVREAVGSGEQVLVFTQFTSMGRLLVRQLSEDLGTWVPFLHGGVRAEERDRMVAAFQGEGDVEPPPVLIVSLRAGGTGLNLTAATQVLHYDRWWNPAVEDQATDRAHRIGQRHAVEVHKLVTAGTVEERIAAMLARKRALADAVVGAGEAWVTELGDAELKELVALSREPGVVVDADWVDDADDVEVSG
ncbi:MAG TPA: DEAD/DEAH box helicase [Egibacteraceae bacterium]|nr:DEAD/DEAH box helicase [Egibacteraceae bacterium]